MRTGDTVRLRETESVSIVQYGYISYLSETEYKVMLNCGVEWVIDRATNKTRSGAIYAEVIK